MLTMTPSRSGRRSWGLGDSWPSLRSWVNFADNLKELLNNKQEGNGPIDLRRKKGP